MSKKRADNRKLKSACYRLCVFASGSLITDIFNCFTLISVSCLHFGQNSGKFSSTVSLRILIRVLLLQIGHNIKSVCFIVLISKLQLLLLNIGILTAKHIKLATTVIKIATMYVLLLQHRKSKGFRWLIRSANIYLF